MKPKLELMDRLRKDRVKAGVDMLTKQDIIYITAANVAAITIIISAAMLYAFR